MEAFESEPLLARPSWASRLVEVFQPVRVRADRLGSMDVFSNLSRSELELVAGIFHETVVGRGARMTLQGQPPSRIWLVIEGEALVSADARPLRVVGHGEFIGLAAMLHSTASPETTIAISPIRAFESDRQDFARLIARPSIRKRLAATETAPGGWTRRPVAARRRS